jgi:hypothetical protein
LKDFLETRKKDKIAIKLSEECLHCSNTDLAKQNKINSAFKLACISYKASDVNFRNK